MAYLIYRLNVRPVYKLRYLHVVELDGVLDLLQLLLLLLLVFMHPKNSIASLFNDVHFILSAKVRL
jgi:hypothetical protein